MPRCPYCSSWDLELELSFDCILSGAHVDWYVCRGCGNPVEVIDHVTQKEPYPALED